MRIWAFPSFYPFEYPGLNWNGIFAHRQYKGLIENGADLQVIYPVLWNPPYPISKLHPEWDRFQKISFPKKRIYDGINVNQPRIANFRPNRLVRKTYQERYVDAIINFFHSNNISLNPHTDIFYSQWIHDSATVQIAAQKLGVKSAILGIGDDVVILPYSNDQNLKLFLKTWNEADLRFVCADYLGKKANEINNKKLDYNVVRWGVDYDFLKPVNNNIKEELRKAHGIASEKIVILNIGSAIIRKGWIDLFDALSEIKKYNNKFILVGVYAGPSELNLEDEAKKRGLSDNFMNMGEVPPQYLDKIYQISDIFCLPSHWEGMANVNIEAMSCGLPVITTNVCGHPELISDGINGILIPPKRPDILTEKLLLLINDKNLRETLGANAREFIVNKWGNFADNAKNLYEKLKSACS